MTLIYKNIENNQYIENWSLCCRLFQAILCVCVVDVEVLYHSQMAFGSRLYGPLDVDLTRIKLHEPMSVIIQQPLLYVRDMVPKPCFEALVKLDQVGIRFIVLYPPKCSHDLPPLAGLYTRKPFQSPGGYSRAASSIDHTSSKHCLINARYPFCSWVD